MVNLLNVAVLVIVMLLIIMLKAFSNNPIFQKVGGSVLVFFVLLVPWWVLIRLLTGAVKVFLFSVIFSAPFLLFVILVWKPFPSGPRKAVAITLAAAFFASVALAILI